MCINFSKNIVKTVLAGALLFAAAGCSKTAQPASVMSVEKIALNGYDPVAYFVSAKAIKADSNYSYEYEGAGWHFETEKNLEAFKANPQNYIPAFGGFCAYELADEDLVLSNPEYWYIHNAKLYLFKDEEAKKDWFRNIDAMIPAGEKAWEKMMSLPKEASE